RTKWDCKYHIVFGPKYRRQDIYVKVKRDIVQILRKLYDAKKVEIIEAETCSDNIHMLASIPPHLNVPQFMGRLKGKSSLTIFGRHANKNISIGASGTKDTMRIQSEKEKIAEYIRNQLQEDIMYYQLSVKEYIDLFTGSKNNKAI
ncbi:MAG: IS200/IS605 family transposase, partial [Christensenellales bacterium]